MYGDRLSLIRGVMPICWYGNLRYLCAVTVPLFGLVIILLVSSLMLFVSSDHLSPFTWLLMQESEQKLQLPIGTFWLLPVDELFKGHVPPSLSLSVLWNSYKLRIAPRVSVLLYSALFLQKLSTMDDDEDDDESRMSLHGFIHHVQWRHL